MGAEGAVRSTLWQAPQFGRPPRNAPLKRGRGGFWAVRVSRLRRITFRFGEGGIANVNLVDYR